MASEGDDEKLSAEDIKMLAEREERLRYRLQLYGTLERRIGIPEGFFWSLRMEENDWAYVVKLSVICEAALTHMLVLAVGNDQLYDHFSDLTQARRLELAKQLGILSDADRHTLGAIAQVRNSFAHKVENLKGSLRQYFLGRTQDQKIDLLTKLVQLEGQDKPKAGDDLSGHAPLFRLQLFASCMRPIQSIANFGLEVDKTAAGDLAWTRADMRKEDFDNG
jgi:aromatic ring-cleaving dioxygenase